MGGGRNVKIRVSVCIYKMQNHRVVEESEWVDENPGTWRHRRTKTVRLDSHEVLYLDYKVPTEEEPAKPTLYVDIKCRLYDNNGIHDNSYFVNTYKKQLVDIIETYKPKAYSEGGRKKTSTVAILIEKLRKQGKPTSGTKAELEKRLLSR